MISVLSPQPVRHRIGKPMCPPVGALRGKRIGLRRDRFWLSWDWVTDEWSRLLEADGAEAVLWRAPVGKRSRRLGAGSGSGVQVDASQGGGGSRTGVCAATDDNAARRRLVVASPAAQSARPLEGDAEMSAGGADFAEFLGSIDVAVSGLGNCGSCTLWAVHDAVGALAQGLPTVMVSTAHFAPLARTLAAQRGHDHLRLKLMPYPLEGKPEDEVRQIARANYDGLIETMGAYR